MAEDEHLSEPLVDPRAPWEGLIEDPEAPRKLLAVMFTDIVGSTELATGLGDKRWRELVDQHHAAIRAQIARFGGREVDTAGDAFFATFELPVRAVDCALESMRAVRRLGLRIRAGVHMGECVVSNGAVRGVTVHIGARVGAKARGDELLVSSTVRDILAGAGLKFLDRGEQTLKGVEGRWRLYAVEPRERDNEADLPPLLEFEVAKPPVPLFKQRRVVVAAATALAILAGAIGYVTFIRSGGLSFVPADSVAAIDAASGDIGSFVSVNRRPVGVAAAPDGVWVANSVDATITRIAKGGKGQSDTIRVGIGPTAVATGGGLIWVANGDASNVSRVSPQTKQEVGQRIRAGNGLSAIAFAGSSLWLANAIDGTVWQVEPSTGNKSREIPVGPALRGLAVTDEAIWVTSETAGTLTQIDPTNGVIVRVIPVGRGPAAVAVADNMVWVANRADGTATRVDARSGRATVTTRVGRSPSAIAIAGEHVFVANEEGGTVSMLDARSGALRRTIPVRNAPMGLAFDGERVWVSVRGGILSYRGGTLRFAVDGSTDSLDPGAFFEPPNLSLPMIPAVYDGLTAFKHAGGPEGNDLVPNLVEEIRPPTDNGTTYSFTLRPGLTYSNGAPVLASDVRESFERTFVLEGYGSAFIGTIKGAEKCSPEGCDLSDGIVTDDRVGTIVFHLRQPYADFPYNLALPALVIVPGKTPKENALLTPLVGTGPYRIAKVETAAGEGGRTVATKVILDRNPRFRARELAQPDGYADRIEFMMNVVPGAAIAGIKDGSYDLSQDLLDPSVPLDQILTDLPSQLHLVEMPWNLFVVMNTRVAPFNNVKARQALNYALDRRALINAGAGILLGDVSCQLLPKNTIGFVPYCPYTRSPNPSGLWIGPDLDTARRLVRESGTAGQAVTVWVEEGDFFSAEQRRARGPVVADALRKIGYRVSVEQVRGNYFEALVDPKSRHQVSLSGWASDYPGAANFVLPLVTCPETLQGVSGGSIFPANASQFCSPSIDALTRKALQAQSDDPSAARDQWAHVDKAIADAAVFAPWANLRNAILASRRAGNVLGHPVYMLLLTQMWVVEEPKATPS